MLGEQQQFYIMFPGSVMLNSLISSQSDACEGDTAVWKKCGLWSQMDLLLLLPAVGWEASFLSLSLLISEMATSSPTSECCSEDQTGWLLHISSLSTVPGTLKGSTNLIIIIWAPTGSVCPVPRGDLASGAKWVPVVAVWSPCPFTASWCFSKDKWRCWCLKSLFSVSYILPIFFPHWWVFLLPQNAPSDIYLPCFLTFCLQTSVFFFVFNCGFIASVFNKLSPSVKNPFLSSFYTNCWKEEPEGKDDLALGPISSQTNMRSWECRGFLQSSHEKRLTGLRFKNKCL